jgi:hypothetical protein
VCTFDPHSLRITAHSIHEWIHHKLGLNEDDVRTIQIDEPQRKVYIKNTNPIKMMKQAQRTQGSKECYHANGEISLFRVEIAGLGIKNFRITSIPPESRIEKYMTMSKCGEVKKITEEQWSKAYHYPVYNGISLVEMVLKHIYRPI